MYKQTSEASSEYAAAGYVLWILSWLCLPAALRQPNKICRKHQVTHT